MSAVLERLAAALADRYRIERELGKSGMATVYLADDIRHGRQVAVKVVHPELAAALGAERFLSGIHARGFCRRWDWRTEEELRAGVSPIQKPYMSTGRFVLAKYEPLRRLGLGHSRSVWHEPQHADSLER